MHYLWEQAEFNKWSPGVAGKRNWYVIHKYLYEAAKDKTAKKVALESLLYIPEAFDLDHKQEIANRRLAALNPLHESHKQKQLMLLIGEVKEIASARFGYKMVIKHLPDYPVMLNHDIYHRLCIHFEVEIELWSANESGHLIVMAVNQHAKITRERVESTLKSFHPYCVMIRHFVGEPWGVNNGSYSRNQATPFY